MTEDEIRIEYEAELAWQGEPLKKCTTCGFETHRTQCPYCVVDGEGLPLTGDTVVDDMVAQMKQGEKINPEEMEKLLRGGFTPVDPQSGKGT